MAIREAFLSFPMEGWIKTLTILPGDMVEEGELLAALDVPALIYDIEDAEYQLEVEKKHLAKAQIELTRTLAYRDQELLEAQQVLIEAQAAGVQAEAALLRARASRDASAASLEATQADVNAARARVAAAEADLALLEAGPTEQRRTIEKLAIDQAKNRLWGAQARRDSIGGAVDRRERKGADLDAAEAEVGNASVSIRIAELTYEETETGPRPEEIASARAQVDSARAALIASEARVEARQAQLQQADTEVTIAAAQMTVAAAQETTARAAVAYQRQLLWQERAIQELNVALQEERVRHSQQLLKRSQQSVAQTRLRAPFPGLIVSLDVQLGQYLAPYESFGVIADPSEIELEMTVLKSDIAKVAIGQVVEAGLDAYPQALYQGRIVSIASEPIIWQGKNAYQVRVRFDEPASVPATIRMGADVTLEIQRKDEVLLVPAASIYGIEDRQFVELVIGGETQRVPVLVGIKTEKWAEVLSGVDEGQAIQLP